MNLKKLEGLLWPGNPNESLLLDLINTKFRFQDNQIWTLDDIIPDFATPHNHKRMGFLYSSPSISFFIKLGNQTTICRKYKAWGIDKQGVVLLKDLGIDFIVIPFYQKSGYVENIDYTTISDFISDGIIDTLSSIEGEQIFLPLFKFRCLRRGYDGIFAPSSRNIGKGGGKLEK